MRGGRMLTGLLMAVIMALQVLYTSAAVVAAGAPNPIRKIIVLMQDMQKEIEAEGKTEKDLYDKFMCFCDNGAVQLQKTADEAKATIEEDTAGVEQETSEKAGLEQELVQHKADREQAQRDLDKSTTLRQKEQNDDESELADQKASLNSISNAIPALEKGAGASSLMQTEEPDRIRSLVMNSQMVSDMQKKEFSAFLDQTEASPASGEIVGILKNMKDEMTSSIADLEQNEASSQKSYEDLKSAKEQEVAAAGEAIEQKTKRVGDLGVSIVQRQDSVDDATKENADATKLLSTLDEQCAAKKTEWAARTKARSEEVAAISQAISILNDDDALDTFNKAVPAALTQEESIRSAHNFDFLSSAHPRRASGFAKAQALLTAALRKHRSPQLDLLAFSMQTKLRAIERARHAAKTGVDFSEVIKMVDNMVAILKKEMADDQKHKDWCNSEFHKASGETEATQHTITKLSTQLEETADEIATLADTIKSLEQGIQALDKDVATATEQRKEEHAEYVATTQLTQTAIQLIAKAKNRLQKFYNPSLYKAPAKEELTEEDRIAANLGVSFMQDVQLHHAVGAVKARRSLRRVAVAPLEAPETFSGAAPKKNEKSGGVMALMDMLANDLEKQNAEAQHEEKTAQRDYVKLMADSQTSRANDGRSIADKAAAKADIEAKLTELKTQKYLSTKDLENIHGLTMELHSSCDFVLQNFDSRKEARSGEIEGLENAKAVLSGANFA